ncbi:MAG: DUF2232 domain-containing protein [Candidatus Hydrogenedentota bacterium]
MNKTGNNTYLLKNVLIGLRYNIYLPVFAYIIYLIFVESGIRHLNNDLSLESINKIEVISFLRIVQIFYGLFLFFIGMCLSIVGFTLFRIKTSRNIYLITLIIISFILFYQTSFSSALVFILFIPVISSVIVYGIRKKMSFFKIFALLLLSSSGISTIIFILIFLLLNDLPFIYKVNYDIIESNKNIIEFYLKGENTGLSDELKEDVRVSLQRYIRDSTILIPRNTIIFTSFIIFMSLYIIRIILFRFKLRVIPGTGDISYINLPEVFGWFYIAGWLLFFTGFYTRNLFIEALGLNLRDILEYFFWFQGLGVAYFYFTKWGVKNKFILTLLFILSGYIIYKAHIGPFDVFLDFRKIRSLPGEKDKFKDENNY